MKKVEVTTPDGLKIAVQDWPHKAGARALLFIHGFSQTQDCWSEQVSANALEDFHVVTYDNRGHGQSDKPQEPHFYQEQNRWADEVDAVIHQLKLDKPILVVWSYGGRIALDYVSKYGDSRISGIVMVCAATSGDTIYHGSAIPFVKEMGNPDDEIAANSVRSFLENCSYKPVPADKMKFLEDTNNMTSQVVRRALQDRTNEHEDTLRSITVPVLALHGAEDKALLPSLAKYTATMVQNGEYIIYPQTGHMPFWECSNEFNADLARFAKKTED